CPPFEGAAASDLFSLRLVASPRESAHSANTSGYRRGSRLIAHRDVRGYAWAENTPLSICQINKRRAFALTCGQVRKLRGCQAVCSGFQFMRQPGPEIGRGSAVASDIATADRASHLRISDL